MKPAAFAEFQGMQAECIDNALGTLYQVRGQLVLVWERPKNVLPLRDR